MAGAHSTSHVAALAVQLPPDARIRVAEDKDRAWTLDSVTLACILNSLNALIYGLGDPKRRGAEPKPLGPSWLTRQAMRTLDARALPIDELMAELSKPRG